jgi:serine/threonine-protein kinase
LDAGTDPSGDPYYVMENAGGTRLDSLLDRGPLPAARRKSILLPLFEALEHIHSLGIIHRDVKPSSILLTSAGVPKLVDFGLAFEGEEGRDSLTQAGFVLATLRYASPEQSLDRTMDTRSDLFSFGAVIYECLTGRKAFAGTRPDEILGNILNGRYEPPSSAVQDISPDMDAFMARMLAADPKGRFATAREAGLAFARILDRAPDTTQEA